jgi:glutaredoxin
VARLELYGTTRCPHTQEMREWLEWQRKDFVEFDVDADATARKRLFELSNGQRSVPVLVEGSKILQIGWQGRTCMIESA